VTFLTCCVNSFWVKITSHIIHLLQVLFVFSSDFFGFFKRSNPSPIYSVTLKGNDAEKWEVVAEKHLRKNRNIKNLTVVRDILFVKQCSKSLYFMMNIASNVLFFLIIKSNISRRKRRYNSHYNRHRIYILLILCRSICFNLIDIRSTICRFYVATPGYNESE